MEKQQISVSFTYIPTEEEKQKDLDKQLDIHTKQLLHPKLKWTAILLAFLSVILYSIGLDAFIQIHLEEDSTALYLIATLCLLPLIYCLFKVCKQKKDL
ncbi:unnamed protein product (macronuclear) [Paramecium tetraurelia]|uniref:Uncharacterized protein n=1 Tax=Paramecium tetraurelia TaxID=5888 RepID=A0DUP6_PARTE|nr:uncharacterized protein GSPATT00020435001 [Paramecium tetraurelia]CAK86763.1 unnamed protein product [Paramecium tetraurelia]|eukprot:XP_001454160.1 hypothetical protein (macronuclear) [Paramecium tetraurelia strain d4-2]